MRDISIIFMILAECSRDRIGIGGFEAKVGNFFPLRVEISSAKLPTILGRNAVASGVAGLGRNGITTVTRMTRAALLLACKIKEI